MPCSLIPCGRKIIRSDGRYLHGCMWWIVTTTNSRCPRKPFFMRPPAGAKLAPTTSRRVCRRGSPAISEYASVWCMVRPSISPATRRTSIAAEAAQQRGFNYLAIGDTHAFREHPPKTNPTVYPGAPEPTKFGESDAGCVAVVFFPRNGRAAIIQKQQVGRWRWRDEQCTSLAELEKLRGEDLKDCVVRLTLAMKSSLTELERIEKILDELKGNEAAQGRAGVLLVSRGDLELDTADVGDLEDTLPDVLKSVVQRLQAQARTEEGAVARQALYHLFKTVRSMPHRPAANVPVQAEDGSR